MIIIFFSYNLFTATFDCSKDKVQIAIKFSTFNTSGKRDSSHYESNYSFYLIKKMSFLVTTNVSMVSILSREKLKQDHGLHYTKRKSLSDCQLTPIAFSFRREHDTVLWQL